MVGSKGLDFPDLVKLQSLNILRDVCRGRKSGQEENVKIKVVIPVLRHLGWSIDDMDFERHVKNKKSDIALMVGTKPKIIVETKSLEKENLESFKSQAFEYAIGEGVDWSLLTNGKEFQLYRTYISGVPPAKNKPVFSLKLSQIIELIGDFKKIIGYKNISSIDIATKERVKTIQIAVTEEDLIETLRNGKQILFFDLLSQFDQEYGTNKNFRFKIDKWVQEHQISKEESWLTTYSKSKTFRYEVNQILGVERRIDKIWLKRYANDRLFKFEVDRKLRENQIILDWVDRLCAEGAYTFINRILLLRICEDRKIVKRTVTPEWIKFLHASNMEETVLTALNELFGEVKQKFSTYSKPIFDHIMIEELKWPKNSVLKVIEMTTSYNFAEIDRDLIGRVYEKHIPREMRRSLGQFYTPEEIVNHVTSQIPFAADTRFIDPACGSGGFLLSSYDRIKKVMVSLGHTEEESHRKIVDELLFGVDIDPFAVQLTQMNLILKNIYEPTDVVNVIEGDAVPVGLVSPISREIRFDVVVSNPPYFNISKNDKRYKNHFEDYYKSVIKGAINISSLFLKRSIDILNDKTGYIGIVLPKSFLRVSSFGNIRKYLLDHCEILSITDVGLGFEDVGYEVITIVAVRRNGDTEAKRRNRIAIYSEVENLAGERYKIHKMEQEFFERTGAFLIYITDEVKPVYELMQGPGLVRLGGENGIAKIWRGLPISKNSENISEKKKNITDVECLTGNSLGRLSQKKVYWLKVNQINDAMKQLKKEKIVVQNIVTSKVRCVATIDEKGLVDIDTVTNVDVTDQRFNKKYVLGIMVSKLMSWFLRDVVFNRAELTMHMDDNYLGQLPIKIADMKTQLGVTEIVDKLLELYKNPLPKNDLFSFAEHQEYVKKESDLNSELNLKIFELYGLSDAQRKVIENLITYD